MQVKVTREFFDREHDLKLRKPGAVLEVDERRAQQLKRMKMAEMLEKQTDQPDKMDVAAK